MCTQSPLISSPCTMLLRKSAPITGCDMPGPERILKTFAVTRYFGMVFLICSVGDLLLHSPTAYPASTMSCRTPELILRLINLRDDLFERRIGDGYINDAACFSEM